MISEEGRRKRVEAGRKGGKATGPNKNRMAHLSKEERSQKMRELALKRFGKST